MVFDLDPPVQDPREAFPLVRWSARRLREVLDELGLPAYVATSGSKGLHVYVPLDRSRDFEAVHAFARGVAELLAERHPDRLTTAQRKEARGDALFIDVLRNGYGQTAVAPYAVRARPDAPVATPLDWRELGRAGMHAQRYTLTSLHRRLARRADPWSGMARRAVGLDAASDRLQQIRGASPPARR